MNSRTDSNQITRDYFDAMLIEAWYWDSDIPSTEMELFDSAFHTPIMTAALSHLDNICENGMVEFAKGAVGAGAVHWMAIMARTGAKSLAEIDPSVIRMRMFLSELMPVLLEDVLV